MTDFIKETIFGVSADASWGEAAHHRPGCCAIIAGPPRILVYWIITRKAPKFDHRPALEADPLPPECRGAELYRTVAATEKFFDRALLEKVVLTGLVSVIFAQYLLPDGGHERQRVRLRGGLHRVNAFVSQWLARRGRTWTSVRRRAGRHVRRQPGDRRRCCSPSCACVGSTARARSGRTLFFVFLFTVITVLFDRYHT